MRQRSVWRYDTTVKSSNDRSPATIVSRDDVGSPLQPSFQTFLSTIPIPSQVLGSLASAALTFSSAAMRCCHSRALGYFEMSIPPNGALVTHG